LLILGLQPCKVLHQLHIEVGLIELWGQQQHRLWGAGDSGYCEPGQEWLPGRMQRQLVALGSQQPAKHTPPGPALPSKLGKGIPVSVLPLST
jgi:hypothetical protein